MAKPSPRISLQLGRFLLIQNAVEDALESNAETLTRHLINTRLEVLKANWTKFQAEHDIICQELNNDLEEPLYIKNKTYERCQEFYVQGRSALLTLQDELEASTSSMRSFDLPTANTKMTSISRTLPRIQIPKFSGDYNTWRSFHDLFLSMVGSNVEFSDVEKMHYLKTSLTGDAAKLIINLPVSQEAFSHAWDTLVHRYDNKRILISAQLDKLFTLKRIQNKSSKKLNAFVSTILESLGALKTLGCLTEHWDPILIHHFSRLLDADTREAWECKLGSSTNYPKFKEFEEFLIAQARAWESLESHNTKKSNKARSLRSSSNHSNTDARSFTAVASTEADTICPLCKSTHYLSSCKEFLLLNSQRRRRFIIQQHCCFNCLGSHMVNRCPSTRRCKKCGKKHHTLIHDCFKSNNLTTPPNVAKGTTNIDISSSADQDSNTK